MQDRKKESSTELSLSCAIDHLLFASDVAVRLANYIARLCPDDDILPHYSYLDLFTVTGFADRFRVISERILPTKFLGDSRKCRFDVVQSLCLKLTSSAVLSKRLEICAAGLVFS